MKAKKIKVAVVVFYNKKNQILMHHRSLTGHDKFGEEWAFLGGGVQEGEDYVTAAKREILEEVGYKLDKLVFLNEYNSFLATDVKAHIQVFTAEFPGFDRFMETDEKIINALELVNIKEAYHLKSFSFVPEILGDLEAKLFK